MMRLQLYEFDMKYKPGSQNILADFLSRLQEIEPEMEAEEDYFYQLVANIETVGVKSTMNYQIANNELYKQMELYDKIISIRTPFEIELIASSIVREENEINNIQTIASEPSYSISNSHRSYAEEQEKYSDIQLIKALIRQHILKPKLKDFENEIRTKFYRENDNFSQVDDILYRVKVDKNGFNRTQFVLPKHISQEVITKIHSSVYGAHLGRKKTSSKEIERMYRPGPNNTRNNHKYYVTHRINS